MRILVTGATGFIGGRFARFALEQGLSVRVSGRRADAVEHLVARGAEFVPGDLADPALVLRLCEDVEAVVHCAGAVGVWGPRERFLAANVGLAESVVEACMRQKVRRLVHLSSPSIYFDGRDHLDLNEEYVPRRFSDHYGATKYQAEQLVLSARDLGLEVLALRPRFVVGAGDTSIFPRMIQAHRKGRLRILGNGLNRVDFTSVHNLNDALFSCLLAGEPALGKVYNISNGQPVPFWDAVNYVMRQLDLPSTAPANTSTTTRGSACGPRSTSSAPGGAPRDSDQPRSGPAYCRLGACAGNREGSAGGSATPLSLPRRCPSSRVVASPERAQAACIAAIASRCWKWISSACSSRRRRRTARMQSSKDLFNSMHPPALESARQCPGKRRAMRAADQRRRAGRGTAGGLRRSVPDNVRSVLGRTASRWSAPVRQFASSRR